MADTATFIILVTAVRGGPSEGGGDDPTVLDEFKQALDAAEQSTGATVNNTYTAQGRFDFIVDVTFDPKSYIQNNPGQKNRSKITAQHIAIGFTASLSIYGFGAETVPVIPLAAEPFHSVVGHICTTTRHGRG